MLSFVYTPISRTRLFMSGKNASAFRFRVQLTGEEKEPYRKKATPSNEYSRFIQIYPVRK